MSEDWTLAHDNWTEVWHRGDAAFERVTVGNGSLVVGRDDLLALQPHIGSGCAVCRSPLPRAFSFCPDCGARLENMPQPAEPCAAAPHSGRAQVGIDPSTIAGPAAIPAEIRLPAGRRFAFAVAGRPPRLFAVDRDGGWLHQFDRQRGEWTRLFRTGEDGLPERSWSAAAFGAGLVVPLERQLLMVDLTSGPFASRDVTDLPAGCRCVSGACAAAPEALVLIERSGVLELARRRMVRGSAWTFEPVRDAPPQTSPFSAPMTTANGTYWAGTEGAVLVAQQDDGTPGRPVWRAWRNGFAPLLEQLLYVDPDGGVWQLGTVPASSGRRSISFARLDGVGSSPADILGSPVLASGRLACHRLVLRERAAVERSHYNQELPGRDGDFLVPVAALDGVRSVLLVATGDHRLIDLAQAGKDGVNPPLSATVRFWDGDRLVDLGLPTIDLRSMSQVAAFVFDGHLFIYDTLENRCWRWAMEPVAPRQV